MIYLIYRDIEISLVACYSVQLRICTAASGTLSALKQVMFKKPETFSDPKESDQNYFLDSRS